MTTVFLALGTDSFSNEELMMSLEYDVIRVCHVSARNTIPVGTDLCSHGHVLPLANDTNCGGQSISYVRHGVNFS